MTKELNPTENAISRRHFLLSTSLATTALGFETTDGHGGAGAGKPCPGGRSGEIVPVV